MTKPLGDCFLSKTLKLPMSGPICSTAECVVMLLSHPAAVSDRAPPHGCRCTSPEGTWSASRLSVPQAVAWWRHLRVASLSPARICDEGGGEGDEDGGGEGGGGGGGEGGGAGGVGGGVEGGVEGGSEGGGEGGGVGGGEGGAEDGGDGERCVAMEAAMTTAKVVVRGFRRGRR